MKELGILIGAAERGYNYGDMPYIKSAAEVWDKSGGPAGRLLCKAAHDAMVVAGRGNTAPAFHLHFIVKSADWNAHSREVASHVAQVLEVVQPMHKNAFSLKDVVGAGGLAGRGALLGSVGLGAGLGSLYWLLSRHSSQDNADIESMRNQINYYDELSRELEDSMRRKYRYERRPEQRPAGGATV